MKPMIYGKRRQVEILHSGEYEGRHFYICSIGTHPTAYVSLTDKEVERSRDYDDYDLEVHGGFTYLSNSNRDGLFDGRYYLGWDYGHSGDYMGYYSETFGCIFDAHRWTTEEVFEEVKSVIEQLNNAEWVDVTEPHWVLKSHK